MKRNQQLKRARKLINGLIIEWSDPDPLTAHPNIQNQRVSHRTALLRPQSTHIWNTYGDWITHRQVFLWRIDITIVFQYTNGSEQHESRRVIAQHKLHDIASECEPIIKDALRHGENATNCHFKVECLGSRSATEKDFDDYEPTQK